MIVNLVVMHDDCHDHCHDDCCLDIDCNFIHYDCQCTTYLCILGSCSIFFAGVICQLISPNTIYKYLEKVMFCFESVLRGIVFPFKVYPTELKPPVNDEDDDGDDEDDGDRADKLV